MNECSVKLVEQELWQREEKGLIGILPVRDAAEVKPAGTVIPQGDKVISTSFGFFKEKKNDTKKWFPILFYVFFLVGVGTDSLDRSSKLQGGSPNSHRLDVKNQHDVVHWHKRYGSGNIFCVTLRNLIHNINTLTIHQAICRKLSHQNIFF